MKLMKKALLTCVLVLSFCLLGACSRNNIVETERETIVDTDMYDSTDLLDTNVNDSDTGLLEEVGDDIKDGAEDVIDGVKDIGDDIKDDVESNHNNRDDD